MGAAVTRVLKAGSTSLCHVGVPCFSCPSWAECTMHADASISSLLASSSSVRSLNTGFTFLVYIFPHYARGALDIETQRLRQLVIPRLFGEVSTSPKNRRGDSRRRRATGLFTLCSGRWVHRMERMSVVRTCLRRPLQMCEPREDVVRFRSYLEVSCALVNGSEA